MERGHQKALIIDRGGRRRIKDRRVRVSTGLLPERRTGLRRRSGLDRRLRGLHTRNNIP